MKVAFGNMTSENLEVIESCDETDFQIPITQTWSRTEIEMVQVSHMWTINNFQLMWDDMGKSLESPTFSGGPDENKRLLSIPTKSMSGAECLSTHLQMISNSKGEEVSARVTFSILNIKRKQSNILGSEKVYKFKPGTTMGIANFIRLEVLFNKANGLLPDGNLTVICEVSVLTVPSHVSGEVIKSEIPENQLSKDLGSLLDNQDFSDVIISASGQEFRAHKAILSARSAVFEAMFKHDLEESKQNKIEITDVDYEVLGEMLQFIYAGKVSNMDKIAVELLAAADKYALETLKVMCEESLCEQLSVENAAETLILADLHSGNRLKAQTIHFINNHVTEVIEKPVGNR